MNDLEKVALKAVKESLCIKPDEKAVIVFDEKKRKFAEAFRSACIEIGNKPEMVLIQETGGHGRETTPEATEKIVNSDVFVFTTTFSLSHTEARKNACKKGARGASLPGITDEIFKALDTDYNELAGVTAKMAKEIKGVKNVKITTVRGMDLSFSIEGRGFQEDNGKYDKKGIWGNLPAGEVCGAPVEGTANGLVVFDHWEKKNFIGKVKVVNGKAVSFEGQGLTLEKELKNEGTSNAFEVAELGIGTNKNAFVVGCPLMDEKVFGTIHIAFGNNTSYDGGKNKASVHEDVIVEKPSMWFDGKQVMKDGEWLI